MKINLQSILLLAALTFTTTANADIFKCSFTEPFINIQYSTTTNEMTTAQFNGEGEDVTVQKNVSFQIKGSNLFELLSADKKVLMKLNLNFKGSDGMSDTVFPYDAELMREGDSLWGGCSSNFLKPVNRD